MYSRGHKDSPLFSAKGFAVLTLTSRSLLYLELISVCGVRQRPSLSIGTANCPSIVLEETILSSFELSCTFVKNQLIVPAAG